MEKKEINGYTLSMEVQMDLLVAERVFQQKHPDIKGSDKDSPMFNMLFDSHFGEINNDTMYNFNLKEFIETVDGWKDYPDKRFSVREYQRGIKSLEVASALYSDLGFDPDTNINFNVSW